MSQKIQIRRGTNSARQTVTFDNGEPLWTTDTKKLYVGDGSTAGGIAVSDSSFNGSNSVLVELATTPTGNGVNLITALNTAQSKSPSVDNPVTILIPPGIYETRNIISIASGYLSFVGLGNRENTIIRGGSQSGGVNTLISYSLTNNAFKNLTLQGIDSGSLTINTLRLPSPVSSHKLILDNVKIDHSGTTNSSATVLSNTSISLGLRNVIEADNCIFFGEWSPHPYIDAQLQAVINSTFNNCFFSGNCNPYFSAQNTVFRNCTFASLTGFCVREDLGQGDTVRPNIFDNCYYNRPDGFYFKHDIPASLGISFPLASIFTNCYIDGKGATGLYTYPQIINSTIVNRSTTASALQYLSPPEVPNVLNSTIINANSLLPTITGNNISGCIANCTLNSNISGIGNYVLTSSNAVYTGISIYQTTS